MQDPKKSKTRKKALKPTEKEIRLLEKLREQPEMLDKIEPIVDLARDEHGKLDAHEIEEKLVKEIQKLGNQTLTSWAQRVEEQEVQGIRALGERIQQRQKKRTSTGPRSTGESR